MRAALALLLVSCAHATAVAPMARDSGEAFTARLEAPATIAVGAPATLRLTVETRPGFHTNEDYPHAVKLRAENIELAARVPLERTATVLSAAIPITARSPGSHRVIADVAFAVCDAERCLIEKRTLSVDLRASAR